MEHGHESIPLLSVSIFSMYPPELPPEASYEWDPKKGYFDCRSLVLWILDHPLSLREKKKEIELIREIADSYARFDIYTLALVHCKIQDYADEVFLGWDVPWALAILEFFRKVLDSFWSILDQFEAHVDTSKHSPP